MKPNRPSPAISVELFKGFPGVKVESTLGGGPMNEVEIKLLKPEFTHTGVEGAKRFVVALIRVPELCGDEEFLAV